jgi:hypothetical protein
MWPPTGTSTTHLCASLIETVTTYSCEDRVEEDVGILNRRDAERMEVGRPAQSSPSVASVPSCW